MRHEHEFAKYAFVDPACKEPMKGAQLRAFLRACRQAGKKRGTNIKQYHANMLDNGSLLWAVKKAGPAENVFKRYVREQWKMDRSTAEFWMRVHRAWGGQPEKMPDLSGHPLWNAAREVLVARGEIVPVVAKATKLATYTRIERFLEGISDQNLNLPNMMDRSKTLELFKSFEATTYRSAKLTLDLMEGLEAYELKSALVVDEFEKSQRKSLKKSLATLLASAPSADHTVAA